MPAFAFIQFQGDTFAHEGMKPETGREPIITVRVFVGLFAPKLAVEQNVDVCAASQRFERETVAQPDIPRIIILFAGKGKLGVIVHISGDKAKQHIRLPMLPVIIPAQSGRNHPHRTGKLQLGVSRNELLPSGFVLLQTFLVRIARMLSILTL